MGSGVYTQTSAIAAANRRSLIRRIAERSRAAEAFSVRHDVRHINAFHMPHDPAEPTHPSFRIALRGTVKLLARDFYCCEEIPFMSIAAIAQALMAIAAQLPWRHQNLV